MTSLENDTSFRVLRLLQHNPQMTQREIAEVLGVSVGRVNYCLRALVEKGMVKVRNFRMSNNKLRYAYILTPMGAAAKASLTAGFLKRKMAEYDALRAEIDGLKRELESGVRRDE